MENIFKGIVTEILPELWKKTPIQIQGHLGYQTPRLKGNLPVTLEQQIDITKKTYRKQQERTLRQI